MVGGVGGFDSMKAMGVGPFLIIYCSCVDIVSFADEERCQATAGSEMKVAQRM